MADCADRFDDVVVIVSLDDVIRKQ